MNEQERLKRKQITKDLCDIMGYEWSTLFNGWFVPWGNGSLVKNLTNDLVGLSRIWEAKNMNVTLEYDDMCVIIEHGEYICSVYGDDIIKAAAEATLEILRLG